MGIERVSSFRARGLAVVITTLLGATVATMPAPVAAPAAAAAAAAPFTFAATGDHGSNANARSVLRAVGAQDPDFFLSLGDLSYDTVTPPAWCQMVKDELNAGAGRPAGDPYGETYPFALMEGNHEVATMDEFVAPTCLPDRLGAAVSPIGTYGREYVVDYPAADPLARMIVTTPGLEDGYAAGSPHYQWVSDRIDDARAAGIRWVIVADHLNYISTGDKANEMGADLFNLLVAKKVDLILQGHEHNYQRSKQLSLGAGCAAVPTGSVNAGCIVDDGADGAYAKGAGPVVVIDGTGGRPNYAVNPADPEAGYFARIRGAEGGSIYGFSRFTVTESGLQMNYDTVAGAAFQDSFTIGEAPPPPPPPPAVVYAESWPGADGSAWPAAWASSSAAGGSVQQVGGGGRLAVADQAGSWARSTAAGTEAVADVDLVTSYRWNAISASAYLNVFLRGGGGWQNAYRPMSGYGVEFTPSSGSVNVVKNVNGVRTELARVPGGSRVTTAKQWLRFRVVGQQVMFRTWLDGQSEPATWAYSGSDASLSAPGRIFASLVRGSSNVGVKSVTLDDLVLTRG